MAKTVCTFLEFTPPQKLQKDVEQKAEDELPVVLTLAPFNPPAKVFFEETALNKVRNKTVILRNFNKVAISIILEKLPDVNSGLTLSETYFVVAPHSSHNLEISFQPTKTENLRHVIHVKDEKKRKKLSEIVITATVVSPVKKKGRFTRRPMNLRAKVVSNKVIVSAPKRRSPRTPLTRKTPPNTENINIGNANINFAEDTFIAPGKDFELTHANLPTTPRRETYNVEDKENAAPMPRQTPERFRKTVMAPPAIITRRRRKISSDVPLEIEECFSEEAPRKSLRRSTYSLNSPGSNSLATVARSSEQASQNNETVPPIQSIVQKKEASIIHSVDSAEIIDLSSSSSDTLSLRDSLEGDTRRSSRRKSRSSMIEQSSPTLPIPGSMQILILGESNQNISKRRKSERFSVDSLNDANLVDVSSSCESDILSCRDSLEADYNSPLSNIDVVSLNKNSPHQFAFVPSKQSDLPARTANAIIRTRSANRGSSLTAQTVHQLNSGCSEMAPSFTKIDPLTNTASVENSLRQCRSEHYLVPLDFSPNFDMKRCTYVKSPCTPFSASPMSKSVATPCNRSYTIIDDDKINETLCDFNLKTPNSVGKATVTAKSDDSLEVCDLGLKTPQIVTPFIRISERKVKTNNAAQETLTRDSFRLKTPQFETPCEVVSGNSVEQRVDPSTGEQFSSPDVADASSAEKTPNQGQWEPSPLQSIDENLVLKTPANHILHTPRLNSEGLRNGKPFSGQDSLPNELEKSPGLINIQVKSESSASDQLTFGHNLLKGPMFLEISPPQKAVNKMQENSSVETSLQNSISNDVHNPISSIIEVTKKSPMSVDSSPQRFSANKLKSYLSSESDWMFEVSPPKKFSVETQKDVPNSVNKCKFKPARVLAEQVTAKSVISPTLRVKRLTSSARTSSIATPQRTSSRLASKLTPPKAALKKVPKSTGPKIRFSDISSVSLKPTIEAQSKSVSKFAVKRYSGVPMSSLKLKPPAKKAKSAEKPTANAIPAEVKLPAVKWKSTENLKLIGKSGGFKMEPSVGSWKSTENLAEKFVENQTLQNPEQYLKNFSQPADFIFLHSATSKTDPFLTNSLFYDPKWLDRQECDLIKWLNNILTPPAELKSDCVWQVDVVKLWKQSQTDAKVELAPSKETVSSVYLTANRLDSVRKAAATLARSDDVLKIFSKLAVSIDKKVLSVREDRDLHLDHGLQRGVLRLLMSYNPLWLRIGLETVYGRTIPLKSNNDLVGLATFIRKFLLSDAYLKKKHSHAKVPSLYLPSFRDEMIKFTLRKFFMLVYFLDQAKMRKLIRHDPCLFVPNSSFKESRELVIEFAKDLIAGVGDITKYLRSFGYILQHKQTYLDEFDYAVETRQDLRDGVRLTRVMEIILNIRTLSTKLRTPAISRLQKIHNVDIALEALLNAGYDIQGGITSRDIVDGHREKTLSLLWQIIYKFQAPRYEKAGRILQGWWKRNSLRFNIQKRIYAKRLAKQNKAATKIQSAWKGFNLRRKFAALVPKLLEEKEARKSAAVVIQKNWRRYLAEQEFKRRKAAALQGVRNNAAVVIQKNWRRSIAQKELKHLRAAADKSAKQLLEEKKQNNAAVVIQKNWRRFIAQKEFQHLKVAAEERAEILQKEARNNAVVVLQKNLRRYLAQKEFQSKKAAVITIQQHFCAKLAARKARANFLALKRATATILILFRSNKLAQKERKHFVKLRKYAIFVQQRWRAKREACRQREHYLMLKKAAEVVQARFRADHTMRIQRQKYLMLKLSAVTIQVLFRAYLEMKERRGEFLALKAAVVTIQTRYRANVLAKQARSEYLELCKAVIFVQRKFRANKAMNTARTEFLEVKAAALIIQRRYRSFKKMTQARADFLAQKKVATFIQTTFRKIQLALKVRQEFLCKRNAALVIQSHYRAQQVMKIQRKAYLEKRASVITIQRHFRAMQLMCAQRDEFLLLKNATIKLQRQFRANFVAKEQRDKFLEIKIAAITIQTRFRATLIMRRERINFLALKNAVMMVQQRFRANKLMRKKSAEHAKLKSAAKLIQRKWRATLEMRRQRSAFLEHLARKKAAITMQTRFRATLVMRHERINFLALKNAVMMVQQRFRANKLMREKSAEHAKLKSAAKLIQCKWRATLEMRRQRAAFLEQLAREKAAITLQTRFRATLVMRREWANFLALKNAVIVVQQRFRANKLMREKSAEHAKLKSATKMIQRKWRATLEMRHWRAAFMKHLVRKKAAITMQNRFRATVAMRCDRANFLALRKAAIMVQQRFRANKLMQEKSAKYARLKSTSILIQRKWRAFLEMRHQHAAFLEYLARKKAAVTIQNRFRATVAMRCDRANFLALRKAAITAQQRFRANKLMQEKSAKYAVLKSATILIQRKWRTFLEMRCQRAEYLWIRANVVFIQQKWRGYRLMKIEMLRYKKMLLEKKAIMEERRKVEEKQKAAVTIQAWWRGYQTRKEFNRTKGERPPPRQIPNIVAQASQKGNTLKERCDEAMEQLKLSHPWIQQIIAAFLNLDTITYLSPKLCDELVAAGLIEIVYTHLYLSARSEPDQELKAAGLRVLINLARYRNTAPALWQRTIATSHTIKTSGITLLLNIAKNHFKNNATLFCNAVTLLWLFAGDPAKRNVILENAQQGKTFLSFLKYFKEQSKKSTARSDLRKPAERKAVAPSKSADWGLSSKPKLFENPLHSITCLCKELKISDSAIM